MTALPPDHVGRLPSTALRRQATRTRVCLFHRRLDAALAAGQDPWDTGDLMMRASELCAPSTRARVASALEALVQLAESESLSRLVRARAVLTHREPLLALAARLSEPAPVEVAVVARLATLAWDQRSPAYRVGAPPRALAEVVGRCVHVLRDAHRRTR
jgi:hypothetical protein